MKTPTPKVDQLRAMREAHFAERQKRNPPPEKKVRAVVRSGSVKRKIARRAS